MCNLEGVYVFDCQQVIYLHSSTHPFIYFYPHQLNSALSILMSMPFTHSIAYALSIEENWLKVSTFTKYKYKVLVQSTK